MTAVRRQGPIARSAALIVLGALAVHQLRYLLAYGSGAHEELALQGHGYLLHSLPILIGFSVSVLAAGVIRAALRNIPTLPAIAAPYGRAALYAASIATVFAVQETAEGLLSGGHAAGVAAVFGAGGWLALPLSLLVGALCAVLDGSLARLEAVVAQVPRISPRLRAPCQRASTGSWLAIPLASLPLAFGLARRPPPPFS